MKKKVVNIPSCNRISNMIDLKSWPVETWNKNLDAQDWSSLREEAQIRYINRGDRAAYIMLLNMLVKFSSSLILQLLPSWQNSRLP